MPSLETVAIVSWKNPLEMWRINKADYDPAIHTLWEDGHPEPPQESAPIVIASAPDAVDFDPIEPMAPSSDDHEDFVTDASGAVAEMTIVDPHDQRKRMIIPAAEYDPDKHVLWSERKR